MFIRVDQFKGKGDTINRKKSTDMKCGITWTGKSKLRQRGNPAGEISRRCAVMLHSSHTRPRPTAKSAQ